MTMIRQAEEMDITAVVELALQLWPGHERAELEAEMNGLLKMHEAAIFLAFAEEGGAAVGFAQCQLRHDYVEGTSASPVGYLEGIFVNGRARGKGLAASLLEACERWARVQGCREFASDCELANHQSLAFHKACGFQEANRIICFVKPL